MIEAGIDVVRLNFSHDLPEVHVKRAETARNRAEAHGREIGVLVDLQGPKIRTGKFKNGSAMLSEGTRFVIDASLPLDTGTAEQVGTTYKQLPQDVARGATLLLDDGRIALRVEEVKGSAVICRVTVGGELADNKGINRQGGGLSARALTDKDREDIKVAARIQADYVAISFPRSAADVEEARTVSRRRRQGRHYRQDRTCRGGAKHRGDHQGFGRDHDCARRPGGGNTAMPPCHRSRNA